MRDYHNNVMRRVFHVKRPAWYLAGMAGGRPSSYTQDVADAFCERLEAGRSMRDICENDADMPPWATIWRWHEGNDNFRARYARARERQAHAIADQAIGEATKPGGDPADKRLAFDARRWFAGKVAPKHFGDKTILAGDEAQPLTVIVRKMVPE